MVDIFDEVSDDLRTERAIGLAKRYGGLLILACVLVLLAVAGQQVGNAHQARRNDKAASAFLAITAPIEAAQGNLTKDQQVADAAALGRFAASAPEGYKTLAHLRAAALYANAGQNAQAEGVWDSVANDSAARPLLRDLANLFWAQHALGTAPDAEVLKRLQPLTSEQNAFHGLAQETQALLYLHEGNRDLAKALFSQIASDPQVPEGVRNRAYGLLAKLNG